jgi:RHS repeat-associated protein
VQRYASTTFANSVANTDYVYDSFGRLSQIEHTGSIFHELHEYDYDDANRLASYSNTIDGPEVYLYDDRGQLEVVDRSGTINDESYGYDANGNRESSHAGDYEILPNNRVLHDNTYVYEYDNEGNVTRREPGDGSYTAYEWDHRNRLVRVIDGDDQGVLSTVSYSYDAFNQLVKRTVDPDGDIGGAPIDQTFHIYDQGQVALEFHQSGAGNLDANDLSHRYLWGPAVDMLLADEQVDWSDWDADGETLWALADHLGTVRDVVDNSGEGRIHRAFEAFGNVVAETHYNASGGAVTPGQPGFVDLTFAFTGRWFDKATGLQNNLNRWYDASIGRWMSEDPIGHAAGDANLYRYANNAPTYFGDPSGLVATVAWYIANGLPLPQPAPPPSPPPKSLYWYYLTNPSKMDEGSRKLFYAAAGTALVAGTAAAGLAAAGALGLTEIGIVPLSQVPRQAAIEYWTWGFGSAAASGRLPSAPPAPPSAPTPAPWTRPPSPWELGPRPDWYPGTLPGFEGGFPRPGIN